MSYLCFGVEMYIWILEVDYNIFRFHFGVTLVFLKWYDGQKKCLNEVTAVSHPCQHFICGSHDNAAASQSSLDR